MKKYISYSLATLAIVFAGCSDFGDTNVSPNASVTPLTSALLTNSLTALGGTTSTTLPGLYCQYFSETLYTDASRYSVQDVDWAGELAGSIYDLQNIININSDPATADYAALQGSNNNQIAIARILKAYRFSVLTDRYGDMPYSEALKENTQPVFDSQESIYNDLFKELDEAVAQFDNGATVKGDILFGGDIAKWKKFANSWRLILALRVSEVDEALGTQQFNDALSADGGVLSSNADDITITYPGNIVAFKNPWFGIAGDFNVCKTMADWLNNYGDPRRYGYGNIPVGKTDLVGVPPGLQRQEAIDFTSDPANSAHSLILNDVYRKETSTLSVLTYADVLLARAEAAERGWNAESPKENYEAGIVASWLHWSKDTTGVIKSYLNQADINVVNGDPNNLEKICTQRWVTFYPNGMQGWSEWRRTGFPVLTPSASPVNTSGEIPVRYIYPTIEYGLNNANVLDAASRLDGTPKDSQDSHVWWDTNN